MAPPPMSPEPSDRVGRLLRGAERYAGDLAPDALHLDFVRSLHAAATFRIGDRASALAVPGVVAVLTADDLDLAPLWEIWSVPETLARPPLALDRTRFVGEPLAVVVAQSAAALADAIELIDVEYEPASAVLSTADATADGAAALFADHPDNVCLSWTHSPVDIDASALTVRQRHELARLSIGPMEGHAIVAEPDGDDLVLHVSTQVPNATRAQVAASLGLDPDRVHVVTPAVGGGFGGKAAGSVPEHAITAAVAARLRTAVRYVEQRSANLVGMQGRGSSYDLTLSVDGDGTIVSLTGDIVCDAGAFPWVGSVEPGKTQMVAPGPYRIRHVAVQARSVLTNLPPTSAYRGPGRAEAATALERTIDIAARRLDIDPVEFRRRNALTAAELPHDTPTGIQLADGDYHALLDRLVAESGYDELRAEQRARRARGEVFGVGVSLIIDSTAWFARTEGAAVELCTDGRIRVRSGSSPCGQHHDAMYRSLVANELGISRDLVDVIEGDTRAWPTSDGSMGSRTAQTAGTAVMEATRLLAASLRSRAAELLETRPDQIELRSDGRFGVGPRHEPSLGLGELADTLDGPLEATRVFEQPGATYPSACHLSIVGIDPETGRVRPLRHVAVTDCGIVLDTTSAEGQVVGASAQAISQALYEEALFDADGTPTTSNFADYGIAGPVDLPAIESHFEPTPSRQNPLGAKGVGEIGMIAGPVAVQNAVVDALAPFGVTHVDMPCTPQRVWNAIAAARR